MRKLGLLASLLLVICSGALAQVPCKAIAVGASGNGSSWFTPMAIPAGTAWTRGTRYYIADGNYGNTLSMTTAVSGTTIIELRKAQTYDFGRTTDGCSNDISAGWNPATMGAAQAIFATSPGGTTTLFNLAGYTTINGNGAGVVNDPVGCGGIYSNPPSTNVVPLNSPAGCGIKFDNSGCTTSTLQGCGNGGSGVNSGSANHVTFEYTEQYGNGGRGTSLSTAGGTVNNENYWWFPSTTSLTGTVVTHNYFHNNMTTYMIINGNGSFITWDHNYAWGLYDSQNLHSEAIQIQGTNHDLTVADNILRDQVTNGDVVIIGASGGNLNNLFFYNNLDFCDNGVSSQDALYGNSCNHTQALLGCINTGASCTNFFVYNNTMAQVGGGSGGTYRCGTASPGGTVTVTNFNVVNNLFYNCGAYLLNPGSSGTYDYNAYLNSGQAAVGPHDTSSSSSPNPFVALNATTPNLAIASENALWTGRISLGSPYDTDILNTARTSDRGAYQFTSGPGLPTPLTSYRPGKYNGTITNVIYYNAPGATICYRTDGIAPTATVAGTCDSPALSGTVSPDGNNEAQVTISATTTLTAIATQAGFANSGVFSGLFTIGTGCTLPVLSGISAASDSTGTQLTVNWTTSVATDAQLVYGLTPLSPGTYTSIVDTGGATSHSITVTGLLPGHTYSYLPNSRAISGGLVCGTGFSQDSGPSSVAMTAAPAGAFDYSIVPQGPTYVTQGKSIYIALNLYALQGTYNPTTLSMVVTSTGTPNQITYGWTDPQVLGSADTASTTTIATDTIKVYSFLPKELHIIAGATTPVGQYTLTFTGSPVAGCVTNCPPSHTATFVINVVSSTAPFNGTTLTAATPSSYPALPTGVLAQYKLNANTYGLENCGQDVDPKPRATPIRPNDDSNMLANLIGLGTNYGSWYYDGMLANYNIGNMLQGDPTYGGQNWAQCVENQKNWYTKHFVIPDMATGISGSIIVSFTKGAYVDYNVTADPLDLQQIHAFVDIASAVWNPSAAQTVNVDYLERESAYSLRNLVHATALGINQPIPNIHNQTTTFLRDYYLDHVLGHTDQICLSQNADFFQPFMAGLAAEWMIEYNQLATSTGLWSPDPRIPPAIACLANYLYANYWQANFPGAMDLNTLVRNIHRNQLDGTGGSCIADSAGSVVPMFGYLFQYTGQPIWQQEGDEIFYSMTWFRNCGTNGIGNGTPDVMLWPPGSGVGNGGKVFTTIYQWAPQYVIWRQAPAFSVTPGSVGFFNTIVSSNSTAHVITLANPTANPVVVPNGGIVLSGTNAINFSQGAGTCGATPITITAGSSCTLTVTLAAGATPLTSYAATLTVTPTSLSPFPVILYGTAMNGIVAQPTITPGSGTHDSNTSYTIFSTTPGANLCITAPIYANNFVVSVPTGEAPAADGGGCQSGTLFTSPAAINLTTLGSAQYIRVTATAPGYANSPEAMTTNTVTVPSGPPPNPFPSAIFAGVPYRLPESNLPSSR